MLHVRSSSPLSTGTFETFYEHYFPCKYVLRKALFYKNENVSIKEHWCTNLPTTKQTLIGSGSTGDRLFGRESEDLSDKGSGWGSSVSNEKCDVGNKKSKKTLKTNFKIRTPNIPVTPQT